MAGVNARAHKMAFMAVADGVQRTTRVAATVSIVDGILSPGKMADVIACRCVARFRERTVVQATKTSCARFYA